MEDLLAKWDGESVSMHRDRETDTWMFICVHSTRLGSAAGGTRMKHYPRIVDALADGMRLAEAMSLKFASVEFPHGGGKAVIALPTPEIPKGEARRRLLREYGAFINSLGGLYSAAPDMNTSALDMDVIAEVTPYVFCRTEAAGGSGDTAPDTAVGVLHGIRAACRYVFDSDDLSRRSILVQGAGGVGGHLIDLLMEADATVIATDVDAQRLAILREKGIQVVPPDSALGTECDVLAPCAVGGIINRRSIPTLRCRVIAGGANNQLETAEDADRLRERGIVYAPDFVINAGGVLHGGGLEEQHWTREVLDARLAAVGDAVYGILQRAERDGTSTDAAARRIAIARIDAS
ncbi:MAG: Glu/Leu/Phe/Val dehydrogenase [Chloroflexi bacterium]|nr:MAG: Glu/Leu/Phe/Val dehydrogenase [Chloroflexota bacterium]TMG14407.1 MAG: Glu/Leu/Phe/Val dehydrogenase [Chloroflexota bacterium]TMG60953.1 MAG: Glu/Leu/Phe/Val dehydrogenase [Chloroflexota bacterium]